MNEIAINLNELLLKEALGSLTNNDFTKVWTNVVMMPIYRIEYIITTSKHTETGYDHDQAFYYGLLNRIRAFLCYERRIVLLRLFRGAFLRVGRFRETGGVSAYNQPICMEPININGNSQYFEKFDLDEGTEIV